MMHRLEMQTAVVTHTTGFRSKRFDEYPTYWQNFVKYHDNNANESLDYLEFRYGAKYEYRFVDEQKQYIVTIDFPDAETLTMFVLEWS